MNQNNLDLDTKVIKTTFSINLIKVVFWIFVLAVIVIGIIAIIPLLKPILAAFVIAYLFNPLISYLERYQIRREWSILALFLFIVWLFLSLAMFIRSAIPTQEEIDVLNKTINYNLEQFEGVLTTKFSFVDWKIIFSNVKENLSSNSSITEKVPEILSGVASMSSLLIIIPFTTFFFLRNGREIKKVMLSFVPNKYFEMSLITLREVDHVFGSYIRGTLLESLMIGILTGGGFYIIGFPPSTALITGAIAGISNAIPYVGPLIGLIAGVAVEFLNLIPTSYTPLFGMESSLIGITIVVVIVQVLDNIIVKPMVIGKSVDLHPLIVILGVMAGSAMFGFLGLLFAIPVIAIVKVIIGTIYKQLKGFGMLSASIFSVNTKEQHL